MPRSLWRGAINFGLVTVPVRLYPAVRRRDVRFHELDRGTRRRVRHQRVVEGPPAAEVLLGPLDAGPPQPSSRPNVPASAQTAPANLSRPLENRQLAVPRSDVVRGFEVEPGRFVEISDEELAEAAPERSRTIDIEQFVAARELDPIHLESAYYVVPDQDRVRPFALLLRAMQETNRAAICWLVLRSRRHLAALQPRGSLMLLQTMLFADEVLPASAVARELPADLGERELEMAELLVNTLAGPLELERYRDVYREGLLALIESRAADSFPAAPDEDAPSARSTGVENLMAALVASVEEAGRRRASDPARRRRQA